jgi:hypothetical protein
MLRIGLFASVLPLILVVMVARGEVGPGPRPCLAIGDSTMQITPSPWQAQLQVGFTDNMRLATVRVQIVDDPLDADFAIVDDSGQLAAACAMTPASRTVAIAATAPVSGPLIYLSPDGNADYRIYVQSTSITPREAAALIVAAGGDGARVSTAALAHSF